MELILISDKKLKIMLTEEDMCKYELSTDDIDYENTETRRVFWQILDEAKHRTGFDAASERVFIQVYPSRHGGCEMYVTKLGLSAERDCDEKRICSGDRCRRAVRRLIYSFEDVETLSAACALIAERRPELDGAIYLDEADGGYYLLLRAVGEEPDFLEEFGRRRRGLLKEAYIIEHCRCLAESGGIEIFARLK